MTCSVCRHENPNDAAFCAACGARFCRACARANTPDSRFCNGCGQRLGETRAAPPPIEPRTYTPPHLAEKILASRAALEGERKQVTVLFADVKGSMELAEQLDPEAWHGVLDRFLQLLAEGVHRFDGTVNQYTGDGIMALFGAPIAHEDHAQRACWAALHLREKLRSYAHDVKRERGVALSVRMGLNSGEVVVGKIGDDLRMDYTAQGHTVGLAQRMEQLADPGSIYLAPETARLADGYVRLRDLGAFAVKGVRDPVRVHELEGPGAVRTRLDVSRARGFSRFVGRADEMAALETALGRTLDGHGQIVGVVAEAGTGKSRLCLEFAERCRAARGLAVNEGHCVAHGKTIPFLPVLELLRHIHGITERDTPQAAREKIAGRLLLLDEGLRDSLPIVFDFLGVPDPERPLPPIDPEARQRRLLAILRQAVQARSRREAAVAWIEDLHWLDAASAPYVETLAEAVAGTRTLLLATFRPEFHARWMQRSHYQQLPLLPLREDATAELLRELLGPDASVTRLVARIAERAAGNPFFAEELVQTLAEHGALAGERGAYRLVQPVDTVMMPPTVQAVLAARIDRLPEREKDVLQAAAVIGREFSESVVRQVAAPTAGDLGSALANLTSAELVYEAAVFPEAVYAFKHPLTQEVAYGTQLVERRRHVHAAVARAIEGADSTKLDERAALVAHHWEAAGEALVAATWHQRAAEWVGLQDRAETLRHWQKVRTLVTPFPESPETRALGVMACDAMLLHGLFAAQTDEEAAALFAEGMELATRLDGAAPRIRLLLRLGVRYGLTGAIDEAKTPLAEAWRLADETDDPILQFLVRFSSTGWLISSGRFAEALPLIDELEMRCGRDPEFGATFTRFSPYGYLLAQRAGALVEQGRPLEALRESGNALEIARARRDPEMILFPSLMAVAACDILDDAPGAMGYVREGAVAVESGGEGVRQMFLVSLGRAHLLAREWREAATALEQALALTRERRTGITIEGMILWCLAEALLGAGDLGGARERAEEAVTASRRRGTRVIEVAALLARARVAIAAGNATSAAERDLVDAMARVDETGANRYRPLIHVERARLARLRGDEPARERELREACRLFAEMGATARSARIESELGS